MGDLAYRVLGLLVQARFRIAALVGVLNAVFLVLEVQQVREAPSVAGGLGLLDSPLLLAGAVLLIAQLPPGVVFRASGPAATPRDAPAGRELGDAELSADDGEWGCRVSGRLRAGEEREWRLLVPGTLELTRWGGVEVSAPIYAPRSRPQGLAPLGVRTFDWSRPRVGAQPPLWGAHPPVGQRRVPPREPEVVVQSIARLAIPAPTLEAVAPGWQYAGLRRYPALRLVHGGEQGRPQYTYVAFGTTAARDAVLTRLV
ncbi:MAG TPA: hypothetical protein VK066_15920 [Chloroflexota bacterium]|nr:hypothetical protein [Chloroflexota bacterium]